jgi:hypothetical protein
MKRRDSLPAIFAALLLGQRVADRIRAGRLALPHSRAEIEELLKQAFQDFQDTQAYFPRAWMIADGDPGAQEPRFENRDDLLLFLEALVLYSEQFEASNAAKALQQRACGIRAFLEVFPRAPKEEAPYGVSPLASALEQARGLLPLLQVLELEADATRGRKSREAGQRGSWKIHGPPESREERKTAIRQLREELLASGIPPFKAVVAIAKRMRLKPRTIYRYLELPK